MNNRWTVGFLCLILLRVSLLGAQSLETSTVAVTHLQEVVRVVRPSGMIHIPSLRMNYPGDIEYSVGLDTFNSGDFAVDFSLAYAPIEQIEIGTRLINLNNLASFMTFTLYELDHLYAFNKFKVGGGFTTLYDVSHLGDWENKRAYKAGLFSHYVMTSFEWGDSLVHFGLTQSQYRIDKGDRDGVAGWFDHLNNVFFGMTTPLGSGEFMIEFDSEDVQVGYRYFFDKGRSVEVQRHDLLQASDRFSDDDTPQLEYGLEFRMRHNYFRQLYEHSRRAKSDLENSKTELKALSQQFEAVRMSYDSLQSTRTELESKLTSLELLQADLKEAKLKFSSEITSVRSENARLLDLLKRKGLVDDKPRLSLDPPALPTRPTASTSRPLSTVQPEKTFEEVGKSIR